MSWEYSGSNAAISGKFVTQAWMQAKEHELVFRPFFSKPIKDALWMFFPGGIIGFVASLWTWAASLLADVE